VILRLVAHGGQATTYEGLDKREGQHVAIKRFVVRGASSWKDVELAEREARVLAGLSHPGIPKHIAHFEEQGELFLVTEYVDGETLDALSKRELSTSSVSPRRGLSQTDVVDYLFAIAELLDYLHTQSPPIIHRDIKPKNVIRRSDGRFVLVDFGSVRDRLKPEGGSTVVGTFGYMAPEQFQGRALPATDTYAAAATALALLTGRDPDQLPHQGLKLDVDKALGTSVSSELKRVLSSALEPDPDRRAPVLSRLLANSTLRMNRGGAPASASSEGPHDTASVSPDGAVPFRTHGYQRERTHREQRRAQETLEHELRRRAQEQSARERQRGFQQAAEELRRSKHASREERRANRNAERQHRRQTRYERPVEFGAVPDVDVETPLRHALGHRKMQRLLDVPVFALLITVLLVLARTAMWFVLGIALPVLLMVIQRFFGAPVHEEARRSRHIARQLRSQMRNVSKSLVETTHPDVRFRVETGVPGPAPATGPSATNVASQLDEEAFELETQLDDAVKDWQRK
jgi:serine/threonine protein kinase